MNKIKVFFQELSIKSKIYIYFIGFIAVLLAVLWFLQVVFFNTIYRNVKKHEAKQAAKIVEKSLNESDPLQTIVSTAQKNEVCIIVFSDYATEVYSVDELRDCVIHKMPFFDKKEIVNQTLAKGEPLYFSYQRTSVKFFDKSHNTIEQIFPPKNGTQSLIYAKPVHTKEGKDYVIVINSQAIPVDAVISTSQTLLTVLTIVTLLIAGVLSYLMAKSIANPIQQITASAEILATGKYDVDFSAKGYKEINGLADTLNYAATELSKVEKLRQEFIANVSHDLRTPLTLIGGYAEVMRDIPGENNKENAQLIMDETQRLNSLVSDVLNLSKIQSGVSKPNIQPYNLTQSIAKSVERMKELLKQEGYHIQFDYHTQVMVNADETLISQCFYNLLLNAVNYGGADKTVLVTQQAENGQVTIAVKDNGQGIAEKDLPYIWERYYKVEQTHRRAVTGTGLGLSIVKSLIQAHNGTYGVQSTENKGSTFWFALPIKEQ